MRMQTAKVMFGLFLAVVFTLSGCGGGGSGSSPDVSLNYKGNTTQATVTKNNAKALSVGVIDNVQNSSFAGSLSKRVTEPPTAYSQLLQIPNIVESNIANIQVKSSAAKTAADIVHTTVDGYSGSCSISGTPEIFDPTAISGTITFNSYKQYSYSPTISGSVNYHARMDLSSPTKLNNLHMSLSSLHGEDGSQSYTLNGNIDLSRNGSQTTINLSVVMLDNTINKTFWMKDCSIVMTGDTTSISGTYTMSISGTYYDHDQGYIDISTVTPVAVTSSTGAFTAGQFLFTGRDGTKARLTYVPGYPGYTVEFFDTVNNVFIVVP